MLKRCLALLFVVGCAHGKMGVVDQELDRSRVTKATPIAVEVISAKDMMVSGDKAAVAEKTAQEKAEIEARFHRLIADALRKRGYKATAVSDSPKSGIVISGKVRQLQHGSAAARILVGMGAGSANMFSDITVEDRSAKATLSKFEVIGTSGGRGGLAAAGSFMEAHLTDSSDKVAEYIEGAKK